MSLVPMGQLSPFEPGQSASLLPAIEFQCSSDGGRVKISGDAQ